MAGPWVKVRGHSALEVNVSVFNGVELGVLFLVSSDHSFDSIQGCALDAILEPVDLQGLIKRFNTILSQVRMLIMLLNVKSHILVKVEVLSVTLIFEGLELGHNGA